MLSLLRRASKSKIGVVLFGIFSAAIAIGFVAADLGRMGISGGVSANTIATVGGQDISVPELQQRVQREFEAARQRDPTLTQAQFVARGGVDATLDRLIDGLAIERFAKSEGIGVSKRMEDAQIASIPAFQGLDGKFDRSAFDMFLNRQRMSETQLRADLARDLYINQVLVPLTGATRAPLGLATPYAAMLLEGRAGHALFVPAAAMNIGGEPSDADLQAYYRQHIARYTVPERRVARYAPIDRAKYEAMAKPSDAEIAKAYEADKAAYAARETRTLSYVVLQSQAAANDLAAKVKSGTPIATAAKAAGLESVTVNDQSQSQFADATGSPALAAAAFAAPQGTVAQPVKTGLGWYVVRVDGVKTVPAKSLEAAKPEIVAKLSKDKTEQLFADAVAKMEDGLASGSTFDEVVSSNQLQATTTPPILANGHTPDAPTAPVTPEVQTVAKAAFAAEPNDDPTVEQVVPNEKFVLVKLDQVIPAAAPPLAQIHDKVLADLKTDRALAAAQRAAEAIAAKVNGGASLAQSASGAGASLPAPAAIGGKRREILQSGKPVEPQLAILFSMAEGRARAIPAADGKGWYVVQLDKIDRVDPKTAPGLIEATQAQFGQVLGQEYVEQFVSAIRQKMGVKRNEAAIARLKAEMAGAGNNGQ